MCVRNAWCFKAELDLIRNARLCFYVTDPPPHSIEIIHLPYCRFSIYECAPGFRMARIVHLRMGAAQFVNIKCIQSNCLPPLLYMSNMIIIPCKTMSFSYRFIIVKKRIVFSCAKAYIQTLLW